MTKYKDNEGRYVKPLGRTGLVYSDKTGKYYVESELLLGLSPIAIYSKGRIYKIIGKQNLPISEETRASIIANVIKIFAENNITIEVS
jgi:hypothetical protein